MRIVLGLAVLLYAHLTWSADALLIQSPQSEDDASYHYYVDLISEVLKETQGEYGVAKLVETGSSYTQNRGLSALESDQLTIFWAGTDPKREKRYHVIRIPLMAGLLGMRVPVVHRSQYQKFLALESAEQLKQLTACQGTHWPDSYVLEQNGYRVERVTKFESMYSMLRQGRCDYFPRGIGEVHAELEHSMNQDMVAVDNLLLTYPMPMYVFLNKRNKQLAKRLEQGLYAMVERGDIFEFVRQHPATRGVFPLGKYHQAKLARLTNPLLSNSTELDNPLFWLQLSPTPEWGVLESE
ncbi:hypothetical protein [Shewanella woodyi]|uniref:hypothetical protein n=1 Tax=Shewanella woodyi TaxID=60961 RepID=UPI003749B882